MASVAPQLIEEVTTHAQIDSLEGAREICADGTYFPNNLRICSYVKSVLRYKFLIMDTSHPDTQYFRKQGCEDPWLFFEAKRGPRTKRLGKHWFTLQRKSNDLAV